MEQSGKRRALGRGLGALIPGANRELAESTSPATTPTKVSVDLIRPNPWQPRRRFTEAAIDELAASIKERGVVQPLVVRAIDGGYQLIAGERRLRASTKAGLAEVPVTVRETTDSEMLELALIENIQRQDLNAIEEAMAYRRLVDELGLKQDEIASRVGKERSTVANSLRLLQLPQEIQGAIETGELSAGHARAIAMAGSPEAILALFRRTVGKKLSVRETERMAKTSRPAKPVDREVRDMEDRLTKALGTKVKIAPRSPVAGTVSIDYFSLDQFDQLLRRLGL